MALLLRWWWKAYHEPNCLWSSIIYRIKRRTQDQHKPNLWQTSGSFFWYQLQRLKGIFEWCTEWHVGTGEAISYWFDAWGGLPRYVEGMIQEPNISLREAWPRRASIDPMISASDRKSVV